MYVREVEDDLIWPVCWAEYVEREWVVAGLGPSGLRLYVRAAGEAVWRRERGDRVWAFVRDERGRSGCYR